MTEPADRAGRGPAGVRGVLLCGDTELGAWLLERAPERTGSADGTSAGDGTSGAGGTSGTSGAGGGLPVRLACVRYGGAEVPACYAEAGAGTARWLSLVWEPGELLVGPAGLPGVPGCPRCAWLRRRRNQPPVPQAGPGQDRMPLAPPAGPVLDLAAALLAGELAALARDGRRTGHGTPDAGWPLARTRGALLRIGTDRGGVSRHPLLPDPECVRCGPLLTGADRDPVPGPAGPPPPSPGRLRALSGARLAALTRTFVDPCAGLVQEVRERSEGGRPVAVAVRSPARATGVSHHGYGHGADFRTAAAHAVLEALERLGGTPTPRAAASRGPVASFRQVAGTAVYPPSLGLHPDASYDRPGFPYARWSASRETEWIWARSLTRDRAVLVPAGHVHYAEARPARPRFVQELSNGCALGASLAEAVLHGLLEVAERDAFLATWYARLPLRRIDLGSAADRRVPVLAAWARERAGVELRAYDATLEQGIPAVWVMAVAGADA
ncbi:TOMM precursor leader peptide-binding protein, partial [Streptomyces boncukensis]|nr:TOMM precursor leader peptide-binding protein [Streptomyces boncukensis]